MLRNLTVSLFKERKEEEKSKEGMIKTTLIRAKELVRCAEKMVTLAKQGDLHARRQALAWMRDKDTTKYLFDSWASKFSERRGGYTRIVKIGFRVGDAAPMAIVELVTKE
jgi:large subunit ribosomal protein L17